MVRGPLHLLDLQRKGPVRSLRRFSSDLLIEQLLFLVETKCITRGFWAIPAFPFQRAKVHDLTPLQTRTCGQPLKVNLALASTLARALRTNQKLSKFLFSTIRNIRIYIRIRQATVG